MMKHIHYPFIVIGGGIGGLAAALSISKQGHSVCVLEKAGEFAEIGAGLQLAPNALAALDKLGVLGEVEESAVFPQRMVILDAISGEELTSLDLGEVFRQRYGYPYMLTHRSDLHSVLLKACESSAYITLFNNQEVSRVEVQSDITYLTNAQGDTFSASGVIGADGLWSHSRKTIIEDNVVCSEYAAYRGTIPSEKVTSTKHFDDVVCYTGPGLHLVQYPLRNKKLYNQVAVFKSDYYQEGSEDWASKQELMDKFHPCCAHVQEAVNNYIETNRRWPLYDREPVSSWTKGSFTLLGDAAHPMLQFLAQGACQALEDSIVLGECINAEGSGVNSAFLAYERQRIPRASKVQESARKFGDILHSSDASMLMLRDHLLKNRLSDDYSIVDWLYGDRPASLQT